MKKIIYAIWAGIIVAGIAVICSIGLKADIVYSKNAQIDVYVGKTVNVQEIRDIVNEVFPNLSASVQKVELFDDMVAITIPDNTDENLKEQLEQLNTKINEKYGIENSIDDIVVVHNPKARLSSIIEPYITPIAISAVIILIFVAVRYRKLGFIKTVFKYIIYILGIEALYLSLLAIVRFPINEYVIPIGLILYVATLTVLGLKNEKAILNKSHETEKAKEN